MSTATEEVSCDCHHFCTGYRHCGYRGVHPGEVSVCLSGSKVSNFPPFLSTYRSTGQRSPCKLSLSSFLPSATGGCHCCVLLGVHASYQWLLSPASLRDGVLQEMLARSLVPGDMVYFSLGDRVPADIRLIEVAPSVCLSVCHCAIVSSQSGCTVAASDIRQ